VESVPPGVTTSTFPVVAPAGTVVVISEGETTVKTAACRWRGPARMQSMGRPLTADDILPLVASLTPQERARLLRLIALPRGGGDAPTYRSVPPSRDEFSADEEPLAWEADGWEDVG
jgi:hypothetical protein